MPAMPFIESHGARIPVLGLGTMTLKDETCVNIVSAALRVGYRHLDTAQFYGNEREVGEGLRASGVRREEVFLTTKVWHERLAPGDLERSVDDSLAKLAVGYVDLLLIHWPSTTIPLGDTLHALAQVKRDGRTRHIGVANFTTSLLAEALRQSSEPLVNNQVEVHPYIDQSKLIAACRQHGISVTAYCPLARGKVLDDPVLTRIGAAHGKGASQVALRYLMQLGLVVIPRSSKQQRVADNFAIFDFSLSDADMAEIAALRRPDGRLVKPAFAPPWDD